MSQLPSSSSTTTTSSTSPISTSLVSKKSTPSTTTSSLLPLSTIATTTTTDTATSNRKRKRSTTATTTTTNQLSSTTSATTANTSSIKSSTKKSNKIITTTNNNNASRSSSPTSSLSTSSNSSDDDDDDDDISDNDDIDSQSTTASSSTAGLLTTSAILQDHDHLSEKERKLRRKAELARMQRRRKKTRMIDLEVQVTMLQKEIELLRAKQSSSSSSTTTTTSSSTIATSTTTATANVTTTTNNNNVHIPVITTVTADKNQSSTSRSSPPASSINQLLPTVAAVDDENIHATVQRTMMQFIQSSHLYNSSTLALLPKERKDEYHHLLLQRMEEFAVAFNREMQVAGHRMDILQQHLHPLVPLQFFYWLCSQSDQFVQDDHSLWSQLFSLDHGELQLSSQQLRDMVGLRLSIRKQKKIYKEVIKAYKRLSTTLQALMHQSYNNMTRLRSILTPLQIARYFEFSLQHGPALLEQEQDIDASIINISQSFFSIPPTYNTDLTTTINSTTANNININHQYRHMMIPTSTSAQMIAGAAIPHITTATNNNGNGNHHHHPQSYHYPVPSTSYFVGHYPMRSDAIDLNTNSNHNNNTYAPIATYNWPNQHHPATANEHMNNYQIRNSLMMPSSQFIDDFSSSSSSSSSSDSDMDANDYGQVRADATLSPSSSSSSLSSSSSSSSSSSTSPLLSFLDDDLLEPSLNFRCKLE